MTYAGEENYNSQEKHCPRMTRAFNNPHPVQPRCTSLISEPENLIIQQPKVPKAPMNDDPFASIVSYKRTMHPSAYVAADEPSYRPNRPGTPTREPIVQPGRLPATSAMSCKFFRTEEYLIRSHGRTRPSPAVISTRMCKLRIMLRDLLRTDEPYPEAVKRWRIYGLYEP